MGTIRDKVALKNLDSYTSSVKKQAEILSIEKIKAHDFGKKGATPFGSYTYKIQKRSDSIEKIFIKINWDMFFIRCWISSCRYTKDVFVCEGDGRPKWCSECENWKPERSHHSRDVGRCVRKFDHFCPWYVRQYGIGG